MRKKYINFSLNSVQKILDSIKNILFIVALNKLAYLSKPTIHEPNSGRTMNETRRKC